ncbi:MAG TPA: aminotransferase class V-fold PLP-dependent enzyme [Gaiella sp.]
MKSPEAISTAPVPGSDEVRGWFAPTQWEAYLDTASYGLPPRATVRALEDALHAWQTASAQWAEWDRVGEECRALAAGVFDAAPGEISLIPAVSVGVGVLAASLTEHDEVVVPDDEFRSLLMPLLAAERTRGVVVRRVPFDALADAVRPSTTVVATSQVRSNGGGVQDMEAVAAAAHEHGAAIIVDATHGAGIVQLDARRLGIDCVVAAAYKHLLCPRGVAFMRLASAGRLRPAPFHAGWRAAADPYSTYFGGTLDDLAPGAASYDVSLAWHPWVGARESLRTLALVDAAERERHAVGLATAAADALGVTATGSSILGVPVRTSPEETRRTLSRAGIAAGFPAGQARLSFHMYNVPGDVARLAEAVTPLLRR